MFYDVFSIPVDVLIMNGSDNMWFVKFFTSPKNLVSSSSNSFLYSSKAFLILPYHHIFKSFENTWNLQLACSLDYECTDHKSLREKSCRIEKQKYIHLCNFLVPMCLVASLALVNTFPILKIKNWFITIRVSELVQLL